MKKKKTRLIVPVLWISFIVMVAGITYLSVQSGEDAKKLGSQFISSLAQNINDSQNVGEEEVNSLTYFIRQSGRAMAFLLLGIVGTVAVHVSCTKWNWGIKTFVTAFVLLAIAFFTEKVKIYIPSRHYSYEEMMISMVAVVIGFLAVSVITLTVSALKSFFRFMAGPAIYKGCGETRYPYPVSHSLLYLGDLK